MSRHFLVLIGLAVVFALIYSWFEASVNLTRANSFNGQMIFSWPDEMASHAFINQFIANGSFVMPEPLNAVLNTYVHPRSVNVANNNAVPMGFLGLLIIYGWLGKLFGLTAVMFFTPIIAVIGVLFFYGLIARIFDKRTGFISALLMFCLAPFWYYANLGMLSPVLFVSLLIIGLYLFVKQADHKHHQLLALSAGLFVGLALIVRLIEFPWVGILILVPAIFYWRKIKWQQIVLFLVGAIIPLAVMCYYNYQTYGQWLTVGYLKMAGASFFDRLPSEFKVSPIASIKSYLQFIFIPFGFHPRTILVNADHYIAQPLALYVTLAMAGALAWVTRIIKNYQLARRIHNQDMLGAIKPEFVFSITALLSAAWIIFYYGNWLFADSMVLTLNNIASSYTRYFLPIGIMLLPFVAYFLNRILLLSANKVLRYALVSLIIAGLTVFSFAKVYMAPNDGLFAQKKVIEKYYEQAKAVEKLVEPNAIIITDRADKLFWPGYPVVMFNMDYSIFPLLKKVVDDTPVYYFTHLADKDVAFINANKIKSLGLKFIDKKNIDDGFSLWRLR